MQFGEIIECSIIKNQKTSKKNIIKEIILLDLPRGFGFLRVPSIEIAFKILDNQPHIIKNCKLDCQIAIPKNILSQSNAICSFDFNNKCKNRKMFVGGLSDSTDESDVTNYFSQYGEIENCVIMVDKNTNKKRGKK